MFVCVYVCSYVCVLVCMYVCMCVRVCMYACMYGCMQVARLALMYVWKVKHGGHGHWRASDAAIA